MYHIIFHLRLPYFDQFVDKQFSSLKVLRIRPFYPPPPRLIPFPKLTFFWLSNLFINALSGAPSYAGLPPAPCLRKYLTRYYSDRVAVSPGVQESTGSTLPALYRTASCCGRDCGPTVVSCGLIRRLITTSFFFITRDITLSAYDGSTSSVREKHAEKSIKVWDFRNFNNIWHWWDELYLAQVVAAIPSILLVHDIRESLVSLLSLKGEPLKPELGSQFLMS